MMHDGPVVTTHDWVALTVHLIETIYAWCEGALTHFPIGACHRSPQAGVGPVGCSAVHSHWHDHNELK